MKTIRILTMLSVLGVPTLMHADVISYLVTTHTGAQTQADINHETVFIAPSLVSGFSCPVANCAVIEISAFDATADWFLGGGQLTMKDGSGSSNPVSLTLYDGTSVVDSVTLSNSDFCTAHGGNCQSFQNVNLYFPEVAGYQIQNGHVYTAIVSAVLEPDTQSTGYFIKGGGSATLDPPPPGYTPPTDPTPPTDATPEPASIFTLLGGGLGLALLRRKRAVR